MHKLYMYASTLPKIQTSATFSFLLFLALAFLVFLFLAPAGIVFPVPALDVDSYVFQGQNPVMTSTIHLVLFFLGASFLMLSFGPLFPLLKENICSLFRQNKPIC